MDKTAKRIRKYNLAGAVLTDGYIGDYTSSYTGVAVHGSELITTSGSNSLYVFDANTVAYNRTAFSLSGTKLDICFDGSHYYIPNSSNKIQKFATTGSSILLERSYNSSPSCVDWDGTHFWAGFPYANEVRQLDANLLETGVKIYLGTTNISIKALMVANGKVWVGGHDRILREIQLGVVGEGYAYTDPVTGAPYYVKVK